MDVTYFTSTTEEQVKEYAQIAISNKLFVSGWRLNGLLHKIIEGDTAEAYDPKITLCFHNDTGKFIGIAVRYKCVSFAIRFTMQAFTRVDYRKKGIGKRMVDLCGGMQGCFGGPGIHGSDVFWDKCKGQTKEAKVFVLVEDELELQIA